MENQVDLLPASSFEETVLDRKKLIPIWIKVFSWIFLVFGLLSPVALIIGILGFEFQLSLYGFQTIYPLSIPGLIVIVLFALKGIVAFGLLTQKNWAVKLAIIDGIVGIALCIFTMVYVAYDYYLAQNFTFRLELIALIPYLLKMRKVKPNWENSF